MVVQVILKIILQLIVIFTCWYYEWFGENSMLYLTLYEFLLINLLLLKYERRTYIKKLSEKQERALNNGSVILITKKDLENA